VYLFLFPRNESQQPQDLQRSGFEAQTSLSYEIKNRKHSNLFFLANKLYFERKKDKKGNEKLMYISFHAHSVTTTSDSSFLKH